MSYCITKRSSCQKLKRRSTARAGPLDSTSRPHPHEPRTPKAPLVETVGTYYLELLPHHCPEIKNIDKLSPLELMYAIEHKALGKSRKKFMKDLREECDEEHFYTGKVIDEAEMATAKMNKPLTVVGRKPVRGEEDVHYANIPGSHLAVRIWGKGMEGDHGYCLDFIDKRTKKAVNMPADFKLYSVPPLDRWWRGHSSGPMWSLESGFGVTAQDGEEKFMVVEGDGVKLARPGAPDLYMQVPIRPEKRRPIWLRKADLSAFGPALV